jgi:hypothetical protein
MSQRDGVSDGMPDDLHFLLFLIRLLFYANQRW